MSTVIPVKVVLLGKEYVISCLPEEESALLQAASYIDQQLWQLRNSDTGLSVEQVAIVTALNIAHEFLQQQQDQHKKNQHYRQEIQSLMQKIMTAASTN